MNHEAIDTSPADLSHQYSEVKFQETILKYCHLINLLAHNKINLILIDHMKGASLLMKCLKKYYPLGN